MLASILMLTNKHTVSDVIILLAVKLYFLSLYCLYFGVMAQDKYSYFRKKITPHFQLLPMSKIQMFQNA